MHHNFGILAAAHAPTLAHGLLGDPLRSAACALVLPVAPSKDGPRFLVPLTAAIFGVILTIDGSHKEQVEEASKLLSIGIETHHMHGMRNKQRDIVVAVPWDVSPVVCVSTPSELAEAAESGMPAVWCSSAALEG